MGGKASRQKPAEQPNAAPSVAPTTSTDATGNAAPPPVAPSESDGRQTARVSRRSISVHEQQLMAVAQHKRVERNINQRMAMKELSCAPIDRTMQRRMTMGNRLTHTHGTRMAPEESAEARHDYAEKMKQNSPFHKRWTVIDTLSEGSYGVVFRVEDNLTKTMGVVKVMKRQLDTGSKLNEWESHVLVTMFKRNDKASVVRLLDRGILAQDGGTNFIVLEQLEVNVKDYLYSKPEPDRKVATCTVALEMLKAVYDLHMQGYLHRDLKPANMGVLSTKNPVLLLYDLGMAKMYTDGEGKLRPPRTTCYQRGTPEWASPRAMKGREQTRFDDLLGWFFVIVELFHPNKITEQALPWSCRTTPKTVAFLRSEHGSARMLIRREFVPTQFFAIHTYLRTANHVKPPDYAFIAQLIDEARSELQTGGKLSREVASTYVSRNAADGGSRNLVKQSFKRRTMRTVPRKPRAA